MFIKYIAYDILIYKYIFEIYLCIFTIKSLTSNIDILIILELLTEVFHWYLYIPIIDTAWKKEFSSNENLWKGQERSYFR